MFLHFETHFYTIEGKAINSRSESCKNRNDTKALASMPTDFTSLREARVYLDLVRRVSIDILLLENESNSQSKFRSLPKVPDALGDISSADQW